MTFQREIYRCEWRTGRVMFDRRLIKDGQPCPEGWFLNEHDARVDIANQLHQMANNMIREAQELLRYGRGE